MATAKIIIQAVNGTKAVFNQVAQQANALNKTLAGVGRVFKGIFVVGILAKTLQYFTGMTTENERLNAAVGRIKDAWRGVGQIIGNVIVKLLDLVSHSIAAIGKATEWVFEVFETKAATAARKAANEQKKLAETMKSNAAEVESAEIQRIEAVKQKEKELADLRKHWHDENIRYANEMEGLQKELSDKINDRAEKNLTTQQKLEKRKNELSRLQEDRKILDEGGFKKRSLETSIKIEDVTGEIEDLQKELDDAAKQSATESKNAWIEAEAEKGKKVMDRISASSKAEVDAINAQADEFERKAKAQLEMADKLEGAAGERRDRISALRSEGKRLAGGRKRNSASFLEAQAAGLREQAAANMAKAEEKRQAADEAAIKSEAHLETIASKIDSLLAMKE